MITTTSNNVETTKIILNSSIFNGESPVAGYTRLGIKFSVKSGIKSDMASGEYGIRLRITGYYQNETSLPSSIAILSSSNGGVRTVIEESIGFKDMVGANFYNTQGYCNQEKVFDITNFVISNIQVLLWEDGKFKTLSNDNIIGQNIIFTNFQLYFGYDSSEFTISKQKIFLYTTDGLLYNNSYREKHLYARYVVASDDKLELDLATSSIATATNRYKVYWETYDPNSPDVSIYSNLKSYLLLNKDIDGVSEKTELASELETFSRTSAIMLLSSARNRQICSYSYTIEDTKTNQKITSTAIEFTNEVFLPGAEIIDILTGFSVEAAQELTNNNDNDDYAGKYFIYGQDSKSTDKNISSRDHYLLLSYRTTSDSGLTSGIQVDDIITWRYSSTESMLEPLIEINNNFDNRLKISYNDNTKEYEYSVTLIAKDITSTSDKVVLIPYRIKDYYSNRYTNNTITCTLTRKGEDLGTRTIDILFGTGGSQGNEYNLNLQLKKDNILCNAIDLSKQGNYYLEATLYNYNNRDITNSENYKYYWKIIPNNNNNIIMNENMNTNNICSITVQDLEDIEHAPPGIIVCTITKGDNKVAILKGIYPLTYTSNSKKINSINNATVVTYDITGKKPVYTKNPLEAIDSTSKKVSNITWSINPTPDAIDNWAPQIVNGNELITPSIYNIAASQIKYSLLGITNSGDAWKQTIYMQQDKYPLGTQNPERLPMVLNEQEEVTTTLVGRLKQENTKTSGIVMGVLTTKIPAGNIEEQNVKETLGIYAYHEGTKFLQIDEDGYIYLNGKTDDNIETGGVHITEAYITNSSLEDISITSVIPSAIKYKVNDDEYNDLLTINNDGTIIINQLVTGTITTANYATTAGYALQANSANTFTNTNSVLYRNFAAIKAALDSYLDPLGLTNSPYEIITE